MDEAVYFVVEGSPAGETPAVYRDMLPADLKPPRLIYALRLDKMADADRWIARTTAELYAQFCWLREHGKLPSSNLAEPATKDAAKRGRLLGEWWEPPARTWQDRPADPWPAVFHVKHDAAGFIGPAQIAEAGGA